MCQSLFSTFYDIYSLPSFLISMCMRIYHPLYSVSICIPLDLYSILPLYLLCLSLDPLCLTSVPILCISLVFLSSSLPVLALVLFLPADR